MEKSPTLPPVVVCNMLQSSENPPRHSSLAVVKRFSTLLFCNLWVVVKIEATSSLFEEILVTFDLEGF